MSNYLALKTAIQQAVYTNGNNEITGAGLQAVLLQIVNTVGDGYVFAGVATAGTSPGTPDANVFYIAPAGTYTNFGGSYTVPNGNIGVFSYNGSWEKNTIQTVSVINALDSSSVTDPLSANQGRTLYGKMKAMNGYYLCETAEGTTQKFINVPWFELSTYATLMIKFTTGNTASAPTLNLNGTGAKPFYINGNPASATNTWAANTLMFVFYDGTNYQGFVFDYDAEPTEGSSRNITSGGVYNAIDSVGNKTLEIMNVKRPYGYTLMSTDDVKSADSYIAVSAGKAVVNSSSPYFYFKIPVNHGDTVFVRAFTYWGARAYIIVDENDNVIEASGSYSDDYLHPYFGKVVIPSGASYIYVNGYGSSKTVAGTNITIVGGAMTALYKTTIEKAINDASANDLSEHGKNSPIQRFNGWVNYNRSVAYMVQNNGAYYTDIYEVSKGDCYRFTGYNIYNLAGYMLIDEELNVIKSSSLAYQNAKQLVNDSFTVEQNGFLYVTFTANDYGYTLERIGKPLAQSGFNKVNGWSATDGAVFDGQIETDADCSYIRISVNAGDVYRISTICKSQHPVVSVTGEDGDVLASIYGDGNNSNTQAVKILTIPNGASYLYINSVTEYLDAVECYEMQRTERAGGELLGMRWCAIGDSLTALSTLGSLYNYTMYIQKYEGVSVDNKGIGGTGHWNGGNLTQGTDTFYNRANTLTDSYDVITVFGSFNDLYANAQQGIMPVFGNVGDTGTDTLAGCMYNTIVNLRSHCPSASIGFVAPTPWSTQNNVSGWYEWAEGWAERYVALLKGVCEKYNVPLLDLYHGSGLYPWDASCRQKYFLNADGTHPNSAAHRRFIYPQFREFLKSLI